VTGDEYLLWSRELIQKLQSNYNIYPIIQTFINQQHINNNNNNYNSDNNNHNEIISLPARLSLEQISIIKQISSIKLNLLDGNNFQLLRESRFHTNNVEQQSLLYRNAAIKNFTEQINKLTISNSSVNKKQKRENFEIYPENSSVSLAEEISPASSLSLIASNITHDIDENYHLNHSNSINDITENNNNQHSSLLKNFYDSSLISLSASNYGSNFSLYQNNPNKSHSQIILHLGSINVLTLVTKMRVAHTANKILMLADDDSDENPRCVTIEWESSLSNKFSVTK